MSKLIQEILQSTPIDKSKLTSELNKLTKLSLEFIDLTTQAIKILMNAIAKNKTIKELNLIRLVLGVEGATAVAAALTQNDTLLDLTLGYIGHNPNGPLMTLWSHEPCWQEAEIIFDSIKNNKSLQKLRVFASDINREAIKKLANSLSVNNHLRFLALQNGLAGVGGNYLVSSLEKNTVLTHIDFSYSEIGDENIILLAKIQENNTAITSLSLKCLTYNDAMGTRAAEALANLLSKPNCNLTHLEIGYNKIASERLALIANACSSNTKLQLLDLAASHFGPQGMDLIVTGLANNKTLSTLNVRSNNLGDKGRAILVKLNKTHPQLTIESCSKTEEEEREALSESLREMTGTAYEMHCKGVPYSAINDDMDVFLKYCTGCKK